MAAVWKGRLVQALRASTILKGSPFTAEPFGSWSPATLFASGEPGGWYDIDPAYMYQDSAGTTPVTAPGQTVGLVLDRSKGLVLGADVAPALSTYVFSSGTTGTFVASGSNYQFTDTVGGVTRPGVQWPGGTTLSAAKFYQINFEVVAIVGATTLRIDQTSQERIVGVGTHSFITSGLGLGLRFRLEKVGTAINDGFTIGSVVVRELSGNHLTQSTLSNRAIYGIEPFGGRRNLLTYTEQFDNAAWSKTGATVTANAGVAPDGTTTADRLTPNAGLVTPFIFQAATTTASAFTVSFYAKADGYNFVQLSDGVSVTDYCNFNLSTGAVGASSGYTGSITNAGNGWYRCAATKTFTAVSTEIRIEPLATDIASRRPNYTANGTSGILIWGAQLEAGSTATAYQRVTDQWNVTEAGKTSVGYLQFDGSDDWLVSPTITPGIDKAQVFAGVRKLSDAASGLVVESSVSIAVNNGAIRMSAPVGAAANYDFQSKGTALSSPASANNFAAPITNVLTGIGDIATDTAILRVNGTQVATSATDQGTGNYLAYPLYVGRRGGISLPYNGRIYSLIVRFGANLDAATIAATEAYVNSKTGAY